MPENFTTLLPELYNLTASWLNATTENVREVPTTIPAPSSLPWEQTKDNFYRAGYVILPTFLIVGLFGNSLTIATMMSKEFLNMTSRYILICLAFSDTTLLLTQPFNKIFFRNMLGYDPRALSDASCKIFFHIFKTAKMTSSWLIVLLCFERFIAVVFPLKAKTIITKRNMFILIGLDYVFIGTYNAVWTFSSIVVNGVCKPDVTYPETKQKYRDFLLAGSSFYSLIPMIIMAILTPIIVAKLLIQRNKRRQMSSGMGTAKKDSDTVRISAMLIGVVLAYIIFILPITVVHNLAFWKGVSAFDTNTLDFFVLREVAQMLEQFNYAINFFLYVLCSTKFRSRVFEILRIQKLMDRVKNKATSVPKSKTDSTLPSGSGTNGETAAQKSAEKLPDATESQEGQNKNNSASPIQPKDVSENSEPM